MGLAYLRSSQPVDKAIGILNEAVKLDPDNANTLEYLGLAYLKANQREKAIATFEQAVKLDPEDERAQAELQRLRSQAGAGSGKAEK